MPAKNLKIDYTGTQNLGVAEYPRYRLTFNPLSARHRAASLPAPPRVPHHPPPVPHHPRQAKGHWTQALQV